MSSVHRIGPKMAQAESIVRDNPGCTKYFVAKEIGPHGSLYFGYRATNRAIEAGLIRAERQSNGRYRLFADV